MSGWVEERNKGKRMKKEEEILMEGRRKRMSRWRWRRGKEKKDSFLEFLFKFNRNK